MSLVGVNMEGVVDWGIGRASETSVVRKPFDSYDSIKDVSI